MIEKNEVYSGATEEDIINEETVSDLAKTDHFLIVLFGIIPFIIATFIYSIIF